MAEIGYARISTFDQNLDMQIDALQRRGVVDIYRDSASGRDVDRPELANCLRALREGDTLTVWRLDRLSRNLKQLIDLVTSLEKRGVMFRSIKENIDTSVPSGRLCFHIFASLSEFEHDLMKERTAAGLAAAKARGRVGGRPNKLSVTQRNTAKAMMASSSMTIAEIAQTFGVSRGTLYNIK